MKRGPSVRPGVRAVIASMAAAVWPSDGAHRHRYFYVAFAIFQCFLGAGIIFGWTSLLPMLESERIYNEFCAPGVQLCAEQSDRLQYAFTMAGSASMTSNLVLGIVFDKFGPRVTKSLSLVLLATGAVLMGSAHYRPMQQGSDLMLGGMVLVGFSGPGIQLSGIHISNLFPEAKALVACFIVGGLQLSFLIFALFDIAYSRLGFSMPQIFYTYAGIVLLSLIGTVMTEPDTPFEDISGSDGGSDATAGMVHEPLSPMRLPTVFKEEEASLLLSTPELRKFRQRRYSSQLNQAQLRRHRMRLPTDGFFFDGADLHNRSFRTQLFSTPFLLMTAYFSIQSLWCNFFLGSLTAHLRSKPLTESQVASLLSDLAIVLPSSVVFIPIVGYLLETCGYVYSSLLCSGLALAFTALEAFAQTPAWLVVSFITYAFFRTVMFPLLFAYLGHKFGYSHFGALSGMAFCIGGIVGLLQAPIARLGDFEAISCLQFGTLLLTLAVPIYEYRRGR